MAFQPDFENTNSLKKLLIKASWYFQKVADEGRKVRQMLQETGGGVFLLGRAENPILPKPLLAM